MTPDETRLRLVAASTWLAYGLEGRVPLPEAIAGCRKLLDAAEAVTPPSYNAVASGESR